MNTEQKKTGAIHHNASAKCPFCHSPKSEMIAYFGQNLLTSQYYCHSCHTPFEAIRWHVAETGKERNEHN